MSLPVFQGALLGVKHGVNPPKFFFMQPRRAGQNIFTNPFTGPANTGALIYLLGLPASFRFSNARCYKTFETTTFKLLVRARDELGTEATILNPKDGAISIGYNKISTISGYRLIFQYQFSALTITETMSNPDPPVPEIAMGEFEFLAFLWSFKWWWGQDSSNLILYPFGDSVKIPVVPVGEFAPKTIDESYIPATQLKSSIDLSVTFESQELYSIVPAGMMP